MNKKYLNLYTDFLKKFLNPKCKLKVVFDCSNGTTGLILKKLKIENLKLKIINSIPDGNFPAHGPNPWTKDAMNQIRREALHRKADLGIIFDADGDRVFFIDNLGRVVEPDAIARLLIWQLQPKKVVIDVKTGWLVKKIKNQKSKIKIIESKVGHYFIKKLMRKIEADLGVEKSGHYYFKKFFYCDAGILTAIEIINAVSRLPYSLANFSDLLPQYYRSGELNFKIENPKQFIKIIEEKFKSKTTNYKLQITNYLDGLTMEFKGWPASRSLGEGWWFNLRPSNTEPLIRLNIEAKDLKTLNNKKRELINILKNH